MHKEATSYKIHTLVTTFYLRFLSLGTLSFLGAPV